jgi:hypothetical protein
MSRLECFGFLILCGFAAGCSDSQNRFYLAGTNDHRYVVDKIANRIVVDEQVLAMKSIDGFVFILRENAISKECIDDSRLSTPLTKYNGGNEYWILDEQSGSRSGPLSFSEYQQFFKARDLTVVEFSSSDYYVPPREVQCKTKLPYKEQS